MLRAATSRIAAIVVLSGALVAGVAAVPAVATPAEEAVYLAAMKKAWADLPAKSQKTTCYAYRIAPGELIKKSVTAAMQDPVSREALSKPEWRRVITDYLAWACSGPGTTPRR